LRHGDPLFPLLFILTTDTIQSILHQANDLLIAIPSFQTTILQFADDTTITPTHIENIKVIHAILQDFGEISGLKINLTKSGYIPISIPTDMLPVIQSTIQRPRINLLTTYLGLSLSIKKPAKEAYLPLISNVQKDAKDGREDTYPQLDTSS
jgi:Reverse transcriptase (RNA-dependent DNA polymerase)